MSIKSKAKKIGKAILFKKLFEELMANRGLIAEDIARLRQVIEEWRTETPDDLNVVLASILVNVHDGSVEDAKAEYEQAKAEYNAEDEDVLPWFENQIDTILAEKEAEEAAEE